MSQSQGRQGRGFFGWLLFLILSGHLGCFGIIVVFVLLAIAAYFAAVIGYVVIRILLAIGVLFGAGITIRNYGQALYNNIKPERVTP